MHLFLAGTEYFLGGALGAGRHTNPGESATLQFSSARTPGPGLEGITGALMRGCRKWPSSLGPAPPESWLPGCPYC